MSKDLLLRSLAENGYNVLFGAKKHLATFDIVEKIPGIFATISLLIGVWQIYKPSFNYNSEVSLILIFLSIIALTISLYNSEKERYKEVGTQLTKIHNRLRTLYYKVKSSQEASFQAEEEEMERLLDEFYQINLSKQILLSDWYAHYKFFFQAQHEWISEQKFFTWRDKIPVSFRFTAALLIITIVILTLL
ncbi:SLATT domain-containing protein [Paenibacillus cellulositrophicus]|uniref:SLATT domain-containing protein n=1 Tax=Paenibacillus cellulositrophicus TaxID=562959 RepID=UPI00203A56DE|nr:SLATT domain-containing protein [Paenibacillus cellulositrophicus]MCM2999969.1 SLATT domain-containing protein [Paenibacillus cellulositrophicus]